MASPPSRDETTAIGQFKERPDHLPHARTCCFGEARDRLRDASPTATETP
jgi:hypothetical protein